MNRLVPGAIKKINESKMAFKMVNLLTLKRVSLLPCAMSFPTQMENIGLFLDACCAYGLTKVDLFQTVDLYDGTNIPQVSVFLKATVAYTCCVDIIHPRLIIIILNR